MRCLSHRPVVSIAAILLTSAANAQDVGGQPEWIAQAKIVAQSDGISVGEAVRRARLQEKLNRAIKRFENDPDYAGAWIEQDSKNYRMKLGFRGGRKPALNDPELQEASDFQATNRSLGDLAQARASLAKVLRVHDLKGTFTVDQRTQRMEFFPAQPERLKGLIAAGTVVIPDFVEVKDGPLIDRPEADVYGAGSMDIRSPAGNMFNCTGGFIVTNGQVDAAGKPIRGISTAAHCEEGGWTVLKHRGIAVGTLMGEVLYDRGLDVAWYRDSILNYLPRVRISPTSYYTVTSVGPQIPGAGTTICLIKRDDRQLCSRYLNSFYRYDESTGTYADGPNTQLEGDVGVDGDSGGPWLYGGVAYGIHHGDNEYAGLIRDYFTPAANLPRMGISVVTQ